MNSITSANRLTAIRTWGIFIRSVTLRLGGITRSSWRKIVTRSTRPQSLLEPFRETETEISLSAICKPNEISHGIRDIGVAKTVCHFVLEITGRGGRGQQRESSYAVRRSEEHTSELQSRGHLVCRLL